VPYVICRLDPHSDRVFDVGERGFRGFALAHAGRKIRDKGDKAAAVPFGKRFDSPRIAEVMALPYGIEEGGKLADV